MLFSTFTTTALTFASLALAAPFPQEVSIESFGRPGGFRPPKLTGCDVSKAKLVLPAGAAAANMSIPANQTPAFVMLGVGVQNYTCQSSVYTTNMAVATLFDASCSVGTPLYSMLPQLASKIGAPPRGRTLSLPSTITSIVGSLKLGDHYFQKLSATAASANPVFDFRSTGKGDFIAGAKVGAVPTPNKDPKSTVAWLQLKNVQGSLAQTVFRVETAGGQAPAACTKEGEVITVPYAAQYWLFK